MRAVLVTRFGRREVHWRVDDEWTTCGLRLATIEVAEHVDLEKLPHDGACEACLVLAERPMARRVAPSDVTAEPQPGVLRTTGPLYHGTRYRRGHRLA